MFTTVHCLLTGAVSLVKIDISTSTLFKSFFKQEKNMFFTGESTVFLWKGSNQVVVWIDDRQSLE